MIRQVVPEGVAAWEVFGDPADVTLFEEERIIARGFVARRRAEFTTGRHCAHRALERLGEPPAAIPRGPKGAPQWPAAVVGSITHCDGYRAAVAARRAHVRSVGIDAETNRELPEDVLEFTALPGELAQVAELLAVRPGVCWDRLLFSAKESVFKLWYQVTGGFLGFLDAGIAFEPDAGTFHVRLPGPKAAHPCVPGTLRGRWTARNGLLLTAITLPALEGDC